MSQEKAGSGGSQLEQTQMERGAMQDDYKGMPMSRCSQFSIITGTEHLFRILSSLPVWHAYGVFNAL